MIDYNKPDDDPIVAEVRRAREEFAAGFDFDLSRIFAEMQRRQATSKRKYAAPDAAPGQPPPLPSMKAG